ncbi:MAG TPA: glycosyltransferase [Flavobacterium sp.]|jgi:glycosyltransferase involved in cell wall biosynthesis
MVDGVQKVALISHSLGEGGAERFAANLSVMLDRLQFEVHNIIVEDRVDFRYAGTLYNLGALCANLGAFSKKIYKGILLYKYLNKNSIDVIIDNRARNLFIRDFFAIKIFGYRKAYFIVHSYNLQSYLPKSKILAKLLYQKSELICVSKEIEKEIRRQYPSLRTSSIYNAIDLPTIEYRPATAERFILFFGRLDDKVKNLSLLLEAFKLSRIYENGYRLLLIGDGPDVKQLVSLIEKQKLSAHVEIHPFVKDPFELVAKAHFTVLTSRYEGFPMSIIESLAAGTPVVSVDCKSGPSELIINRKNGLLVSNHNAKALAEAFVELAEDAELYHLCKNNARDSVKHLSVENISQQWKQLLSNK